MPSALSTYREGSLHAALKAIYASPDGRTEEVVDGFVVDVVAEGRLIEVQTASFASATRKLRSLVERHPVELVYPIAVERWLVTVDEDGAVLSRRRSPKRGLPIDLFEELVAFPDLICHPSFTLEVALIREEEVRGPIPPGAHYRYPRKWLRLDRRLLEVVDTVRVLDANGLAALLPALPDPFTSADIAAATGRSRRLAMRTAYCLAKSGAAICLGREGRLQSYRMAGETPVNPVEGDAAPDPALEADRPQ